MFSLDRWGSFVSVSVSILSVVIGMLRVAVHSSRTVDMTMRGSAI